MKILLLCLLLTLQFGLHTAFVSKLTLSVPLRGTDSSIASGNRLQRTETGPAVDGVGVTRTSRDNRELTVPDHQSVAPISVKAETNEISFGQPRPYVTLRSIDILGLSAENENNTFDVCDDDWGVLVSDIFGGGCDEDSSDDDDDDDDDGDTETT
jgi:hypothetical protein